MITYEEALETAKVYLEGIDRCVEYPEVWMFCNTAHEDDIGGFYAPAIIRKEDGVRVPTVEFYMTGHYNTDNVVRDLSVD